MFQRCAVIWENFLRIRKSISQLVKADREGDFLLHTQAVGDLNIIYTGGVGVHYQRCCSFYPELIKMSETLTQTSTPTLCQKILL